jgi:hypothetical protein
VIRIGTQGRIVDVDGSAVAGLFNGARARVTARRFHPDGVIVELLDDGPNWRRGMTGEIPLRYFIPNKGRSAVRAKPTRAHARVKKNAMGDILTEHDYKMAARFDAKKFGLTPEEALRLVKDARYPGILKTIGDWAMQHGAAMNSPLVRGHIYELLGIRGWGRRR